MNGDCEWGMCKTKLLKVAFACKIEMGRWSNEHNVGARRTLYIPCGVLELPRCRYVSERLLAENWWAKGCKTGFSHCAKRINPQDGVLPHPTGSFHKTALTNNIEDERIIFDYWLVCARFQHLQLHAKNKEIRGTIAGYSHTQVMKPVMFNIVKQFACFCPSHSTTRSCHKEHYYSLRHSSAASAWSQQEADTGCPIFCCRRQMALRTACCIKDKMLNTCSNTVIINIKNLQIIGLSRN